MAQVHKLKSFSDLSSLIQKHMEARTKRVIVAVQKTAAEVEPSIRQRIPEAFGRLRKQLGIIRTKTGARIRDDAPYAAAIEVGSRPHTPPLAPLIDWVLLKGMARDLPEATRIARRVQQAIRKNGTHPVWYMRASLPAIRERLAVNVRKAVFTPD